MPRKLSAVRWADRRTGGFRDARYARGRCGRRASSERLHLGDHELRLGALLIVHLLHELAVALKLLLAIFDLGAY